MISEEDDVVVCRACLEECSNDEYKSIYRRKLIRGQQTTLASMLGYCTNLNFTIKESFLPRNMCDSCIQALVKLYIFKQMVIKSDETLRQRHNNIKRGKQLKEDGDNLSELLDTSSEQEMDINHVEFLNLGIVDSSVKEIGDIHKKSTVSEKAKQEGANIEENIKTKGFKNTDCQISGPHKCDICGKSYRRPTSFRKHMIMHTAEKPFQCCHCDRGFTQKSAYNRHMLTHTGEKQFSCEICDQDFRYSSNLVKHKRIHTGERPFECQFCDKSFRTWSKLNRHKLVHTGEKLFSCEICNKSFQRRGDMEKHRKKTHEIPTSLVASNGESDKLKLSKEKTYVRNKMCT